MNYVFFDTETTGLGDNDRLCQLAFQIYNEGEEINAENIHQQMFNPGVPITASAMAVNHITNGMVKDLEPFEGSELYDMINSLSKSHIFVAHNAKFDLRMLDYHGIKPREHICTMQVAKKVMSYSSYSLQYLRYKLDPEWGLGGEEAKAHTAEGDVKVLMALFDILKEEMSIKHMLRLCN